MPTLNWIGKEAVITHHREVPYRLLEPDPTLGLAEGEAGGRGNLIVEGDNLHALKSLLPRYAGQVKCIYIDPPYNTGNEGWVYNDNVKAPEIVKWLGEVVGKEAEDLSRHDKWLCMMYPRLVLLKQFLREDGAIFVSIDDNEIASLRLLMDEVFGRGNFVACSAWQKRYSRENRVAIGDAHEYVVTYAIDPFKFKATARKLPLGPKQLAVYKNPNNDPRGKWRAVSLSAQGFRPNQMYEIVSPTTGKTHSPPEGSCWKVIEPEYKRLLADGRIYFGKDGNAIPSRIQFLSTIEGIAPWTWWPHEEVGHTDESRKEVQTLFGTQTAFDTPKPTRLIQRILQIATDTDSLILDSFAGSGTTGHAVLKQNAEDGGTRRFILVEMEPGIARDITAERVRRVAAGYTDAKGKAVPGLGGGFQYCRLSAEPLFNEFGDIRDDVTFSQLADFVWFTETGTGYLGGGDSPLLGIHEGRAVYLLFNGILGDRRPEGGNILTRPVLDSLPAHEGERTIYAAATRLGEAALRRAGITFKQTPYAIGV
jgi:site-specific DNA-methyltransferase (adenine-specific)/adenine-specific DNA-methyltransferase